MKVFKRITSFFITCVIIVGTLNTLPSNLNGVLAADDKSSFNEKSLCTYVWHLEPSVEAEDIIVYNLEEEGYDHSIFNDLAYIKKNGKYGIIDYEGGFLADCTTEGYLTTAPYVGQLSAGGLTLGSGNGDFIKYDYSDGIGLGDVNRYYSKIDETVYICSSLGDDGEFYRIESQYNYSDNELNTVRLAEFRAINNSRYELIEESKGIDWGIAKGNKLIVDCEYEAAIVPLFFSYNKNLKSSNVSAIRENGKWCYVDSNGKKITDFIYNGIEGAMPAKIGFYFDQESISFNSHHPYLATEGLIAVKTDKGAGFIDINGKEVIPVGTFEEVRPVHNNLAWVKDKTTGLWGVIDIVRDASDWRQLYAEKLRDYIASNDYSNDIKFDLYDLNDDNIPELIISEGTYHMAKCYIYTVNEEKVIELGNYGQFGLVNFIEEKNLLYVVCNQGHSFVDFYKVKKDSVDLIFEAYTSELGQILGHDDAEYIVNGVPSTKEAYESGIELYYDSYKVKGDIGRQFELDENTIVKVFETMYSNNNSNYQVFDIGCSWTQAKEICEALGGNLVSINTKEEQSFIEEILESQIKDNYWIGGYRSGDTWRWCDGTGISYTNWDSWTGYDGEIHSQPDNYTGDENYIRIASRYIEYSDWLVNAGKWIDTANTADGISSGEAGLRTFGFVCEWEQSIDPFVQAHLDFIEENPDAFVNAEDIYVLAETKKLMYEYDSEITTYNGLKSIQNLISGDIDTDTFNAELTAQAILTDLLCSQETLNAMDTAAKKAEDAFLIQALDVFLKNASVFKIDGIALAELNVLCETDDKSSTEYAIKCKEWIYEFVPTVEIELLSMYFDVTGKSGENLLLNVGEGVIETSEKYIDFCIAVKGYNAADDCLRKALDVLALRMQRDYGPSVGGRSLFLNQNVLGSESERKQKVLEEFQKYYSSVINTSEAKYLEYATSLVERLAINSTTQAVATLSKELILVAVQIACPTLGAVLEAMDLAFSIGMNVWEILSNVDERALERDMFLNMLVYYDAIVNAMNETFKDRLITEKTLDSVYTYEEGLGFYKKITKMMVDYGIQYYSMLYENISKTGYTKNEFYEMAEYVEGMLGTTYVERMLAILKEQQELFVGDEELEKRLKLELGYVKLDLLNEITNRKLSLKLHEVDAIAVNCHESFIGPSQEIKEFDYEAYHIFCPVNLIIKNDNTLIAEVTEDVLTMYDETAPVAVNIIKEKNDTYASKSVLVPMGYDVEVTGYADGSMHYEKLIVRNGDVTCVSTISNIPVKNGSIYREITEADKVVALECDLDNDGLVEQVIYAQENEFQISTIMNGDVNADGTIDASDASLVLAEYAKIQTGGVGELTETQQKAADVNGDGVVDSSDASKILAYYAMVSIGKDPKWDLI